MKLFEIVAVHTGIVFLGMTVPAIALQSLVLSVIEKSGRWFDPKGIFWIGFSGLNIIP